MSKVKLQAKVNCKSCLGTGFATPFHALCGKPVCSCITEQIIIVVPKGSRNYSIPGNERYVANGNVETENEE